MRSVMAEKKFILQGVTPQTHADAVRKLLKLPNIERAILSVAFVAESGVRQIERQLAVHANNVIAFAGIRNDTTSHQGLARLYGILGDNLYTVDTGSRQVIFHPKLYLVRGQARACLVIGSANLTLGGLNNNIEAGMMLDLDLTDAEDRAIAEEIEKRLIALPKDYPNNVKKVGGLDELDKLLADGLLVDEAVVRAPRSSPSGGAGGAADKVPRIKLKVKPLWRPITRVKAPKAVPAPPGAQPAPATGPAELELVWESKPLVRRDLSIPVGAGTHRTGSVNLDKGLLSAEIDHRHYFREEIFSSLAWASRSKTVDEAVATFQLVVKGVMIAEFDLVIHHTTSTTSRAYMQRNAMTRLSWGPMRKYIARPELIGRTLSLYRDRLNPQRFALEID